MVTANLESSNMVDNDTRLENLRASFSSSFRRLKRHKGVTPTQIHKEAGFPYASLCHWETGLCIPRLLDLITLARFFGVTLEVLLGLKEWKQ